MTSRVMLAFVLMVTAMQSHAQLDDEYRWETGAGIGLTGYLGDFNGNITRDFRPAATLQLRRVINPSMDVRLAATMGGIKGNSDNTATIFPDYAAHPYHFSHKLMDVGLAYEYNLWPYGDRKSTRLNSSHANISYAVFCLKKKKKKTSSIRHFRETE